MKLSHSTILKQKQETDAELNWFENLIKFETNNSPRGALFPHMYLQEGETACSSPVSGTDTGASLHLLTSLPHPQHGSSESTCALIELNFTLYSHRLRPGFRRVG